MKQSRREFIKTLVGGTLTLAFMTKFYPILPKAEGEEDDEVNETARFDSDLHKETKWEEVVIEPESATGSPSRHFVHLENGEFIEIV